MIIDPIIIATVTAILLILGAIIHSIWANKLSSPSKRDEIAKQASEGLDEESKCRLKEARELKKHERRALWHNHLASTALTIGHVIVGGVLASSFFEAIFKDFEYWQKIPGILGLLVLLSSLIQQTFRPDVKYAGAKHRVIELENLIRHIEDRLFERRERNIHEIESLLEIRKQVSDRIGTILEQELNELIPTKTNQTTPLTEKINNRESV